MKLWNYMAIMLGMMIFLYFLGFNPVGTNEIFNYAGVNISSQTGELISSDISGSSWFNAFFGGVGILATVLTVGAIVVGLFTKSFEWKIVTLPFFTLFVFNFIKFGLSIIFLAQATGERWLIAIVSTVFIPLIIMFGVSIVEWFSGGDN